MSTSPPAYHQQQQVWTLSISLHGDHRTIRLDAWPQLSVEDLLMRVASFIGWPKIYTAYLELHHGDSTTLPRGARLSVLWATFPADTTVNLKLTHKLRVPSGAARWPDEGSQPVYTIASMVATARVALAMPVHEPSRETFLQHAADELHLMPCTFSSWAECFEQGLLPLGMELVEALPLDSGFNGDTAGTAAASLASILSLPRQLGPQGPLYAAMCVLQAHTACEQRFSGGLCVDAIGSISGSASAAGGDGRAGGGAGACLTSLRHQLRQLAQEVLDDMCCYGTELGASLACGSSSGALDAKLRAQLVQLLQPFAADELLVAARFIRGDTTHIASSSLMPSPLPCGVVPSSACHRSVLNIILSLLQPAATGGSGSENSGDMGTDALLQVVQQQLGPPPLASPHLVVSMALLVRAHLECHGACTVAGPPSAAEQRSGAAEPAAANTAAAGADGSGGEPGQTAADAGVSGGAAGSAQPPPAPEAPPPRAQAGRCRCCLSALPPAMDWARDLVKLLDVSYAVYCLAGGGTQQQNAGASGEAAEAPSTPVPARAAVHGPAALSPPHADADASPSGSPATSSSGSCSGQSTPITITSSTPGNACSAAGSSPAAVAAGSPQATAGGGGAHSPGLHDMAALWRALKQVAPHAHIQHAAAQEAGPASGSAGGGASAGAGCVAAKAWPPAAAAAGDACALLIGSIAAVVQHPCIVQGLTRSARRARRHHYSDEDEDQEESDGSGSGNGTGSSGCPVSSASASALCSLALWRDPRLADCAPAAACQQQLLERVFSELNYVYEEDDYDAPVLFVSREDLLASSVAELMGYSAECFDADGLCINFNEEAAFGDGVLREWLTEVARDLFNPNNGLFRPCCGDQRALHISAAGGHQDNQMELMQFAGRILGFALRAGVPLGVHLSSALYKLLQRPGDSRQLGVADLEQLEPQVAATCRTILANSGAEDLGLTFVACCGHLGLAAEVALVADGEHVAVTDANKADYVARLAAFYCCWGCSSTHHQAADGLADAGCAQQQGVCSEERFDVVSALAQGLADVVVCRKDSVMELAQLLAPIGLAAFNARLGGELGGLDMADWRDHTNTQAFKSEEDKACLEAFWRVVSGLSPEDQRRMLQFWTGISHLPVGGFAHLAQQLQLVPAHEGAAAGALQAHTCFFQMHLPRLADQAAMEDAVALSLANMGAFWNE